jgi:hypothetical protein
MGKIGLEFDERSVFCTRAMRKAVTMLSTYNDGQEAVQIKYDMYRVTAGDPAKDAVFTEYNLTFTEADLLFDRLLEAKEHPVIILDEGEIPVRGYSPERGEEWEPRYEILNGIIKITGERSIDYQHIEVRDQYIYHQDSGHGWLEVPLKELRDLGIAHEITLYSFNNKGMIYLEEDRDAGKFLEARKKHEKPYRLLNNYIDGLCYIREFPRFESKNEEIRGIINRDILKKQGLPENRDTKKIIIGRAVHGVSLNGLEYLLDERGKEKIFSSTKAAKDFLKGEGVPEKDLDSYVYQDITDERPEKSGQKRNTNTKRQNTSRDDDFGR